MKEIIRNIVSRTYKPALKRYLSKTRIHNYKGLRIEVPTGVFHPGFFFSTKLLVRFVESLSLQNKSFIEPGCGSGLISLVAARRGAQVTAVDISRSAVDASITNSIINELPITIIHSNLFQNVRPQQFDVIAINPPYYQKPPENDADHAWNCGEQGEYFQNLFHSLPQYMHEETVAVMVLFEGCNFNMIQSFAESAGLQMNCFHTSVNLLEKNYLFKIQKQYG